MKTQVGADCHAPLTVCCSGSSLLLLLILFLNTILLLKVVTILIQIDTPNLGALIGSINLLKVVNQRHRNNNNNNKGLFLSLLLILLLNWNSFLILLLNRKFGISLKKSKILGSVLSVAPQIRIYLLKAPQIIVADRLALDPG